ncbi:MAG: Zn-dependent hydrolase, partial [Cyclobacteriaceae bacterium]|nr:Zn-dependent hydrolase [Cyclobacteriaceae bacterium]
MTMKRSLYIPFIILVLFSCQSDNNNGENAAADNLQEYYFEGMYVPFKLTADLGILSGNEKKMIPFLIEAADIMDQLFWYEAYGNKDSLLNLPLDNAVLDFARINYGPWDRLNDNEPFIDGVGEKPKGANFYPEDMTKEEFERTELPGKENLYTMIRRDHEGKLKSIPYHEYFDEEVVRAATLLENAAELAEDEGLKKYLLLRADALRNDEYLQSDLAWMEMTSNTLDVVIGPIETYEDKLYGYKAAHEAYILIKDKEWSERLDRYEAFLPELQHNLPVPDEYKKEQPGSEGQLNAYDVIYYAGDCNAGSKTIAINLPNDEKVQLTMGTRRLQLKNAMKAKFDKILIPIAHVLIEEGSRNHITFDAFFANTMFHEVAHGLGIKNTVTGNETVRSALKEHASALEEGKADVLGLYMINELYKKGEIEGDLE